MKPFTDQRLLQESAPHVVGALTRKFGDFAAAEDATQEALIAASKQWPESGLPDNPTAWLIRVASRRLIDDQRSEAARHRREEAADGQSLDPSTGVDDSLTVLFMCCHPSLSSSAASALTLRAAGGLTTAEIAAAFLVPESTIAQRISRAKHRIAESGSTFQMPTAEALPQRLRVVLQVLYLIFNEGYAATSGSTLARDDLATEAMRLTRMVHERLPEEPEVAGLLALMLLTDARRDARTNEIGELIPLTEQERSLWNADAICEGVQLLSAALPRGAVGPYQLQAAVAALHDEAERPEDTDWAQINALYAVLERMTANPAVTLNRAVAVAMVDGPAAGLELLDSVAADSRIARTHRIDAVRAHLMEMTGATSDASRLYRSAAAKTTSRPEQHYLLKRAANLNP